MPKIRILIVAAANAALAFTPSLAWAQAQAPSDADRYGYWPAMMGWGGAGYGMIFGPLFMILMFAIAVLLVRWFGGAWQGTAPSPAMPTGKTALDILRERFARGEIDKSEYEEKRGILGNDPSRQ